MKDLFKLNDTVMYGGHGACTLVEISEKDFGGEVKSYYVLRPAFSGSSVFYVPIDSEVLTSKMRSLKCADAIKDIVAASAPSEWIFDDRTRQNGLKKIIDGGGTETLVSSYKMLFIRQAELVEEGKKLRAADDRYMRDIEKLLVEEFSFAFCIKKDELASFVINGIVPEIKK